MANSLNAIQAYSPRILKNKLVELNQLVNYIADRTGLNRGTIRNVLAELHDGISFYSTMGYPVKLEGLGILSPGIDRDGKLRINFRPDKELTTSINNTYDSFHGNIKNKDMIGKTVEDYIRRWNREHPDDPVE
jgi:hypothetical protein